MNKLVLGIMLASSSATVLAAEGAPSNNWVGGISYIDMSDETDGSDFSLGGIVGSLGYKIESGDNFYWVPEVRVGTGISDESFSFGFIDVNVELESFLAFSLRGQFEFDNGVYAFAAPTYANVEFKGSASGYGLSSSVTEDSWEFGVGGGVGYNFNDTTSAEMAYEQFDGTDVLSLGLKFNF